MHENLTQHRSEPAADAAGASWDIERWLAAIAAGACVVEGLRRRSAAGSCLLLAGGALAWWAAVTPDTRRTVRAAVAAELRGQRRADQRLDEALKESFPASDAPAVSAPPAR